MKINFSRILHYIWPLAKEYKISFFLVLLAYGTGVVLDAILKPLIFKQIIDLFSSDLPKDVVFHQALYFFAITCVIIFLYNIAYRVGDFSGSYFQSKVMKRLYDFTFENLLKHSYHFFSNNFSGSIIAKAKRFTRSFETFSDIIFFQIWFSVVTLSGIFIILFPRAPLLAYIFLGWSVFYIFITLMFVRKKIPYDVSEAAADSLVTGSFSDAILNILNIKIFSSNKKEENNFKVVTTDQEIKQRKSWYFGNVQNMVQSLMMGLLQIAVLFVSINLWHEDKLSLGMLVLLQTYMLALFDILWNLARSLIKAIKALTDMKEIVDILDLPIDIIDPLKPEVLKIQKGNVVFKNISFAYKGGNSVLKDFNLDIAPGERIGLVGHSGAGKSTITKLLLRFADTTEGDIIIDGQNIKNISQNDLRSVISYVPQESILFHRTIRENIAYSRPNATNEEIISVAKKAHADEFVSKLPNGYSTLVGERGIKLSGGERQRIAIARAMLKDSPILVLDEATSSLDSISESYIQDAFNELMRQKTTIVIAHRLSTIQKMDRIIVLENGKIVEEGTHKELLEKKGYYADLWEHQTGGFLE
ncbi:MAG: ABC transporter ATP-binding protein [Patescibacteria group bacterium]